MPMTAPPPRIGKTTGKRPRPADSEKIAKNARFHVASEVAATASSLKKPMGLINRG
jgi:hypothetical protein